ncbi:hypothetical protein [Streptomyces sp. NPDC101234]|uniref:hypothetical protein n=1 Tax=Streptomyces sp. NPDC101234 TaxID=3366138 RepID=UPI00382FFDA0
MSDPPASRRRRRITWYKPDAALGIANMYRATFDEVKQGRDFANRGWDELPDDRELAVEAEARCLDEPHAKWSKAGGVIGTA